jgi:hypothetical protein
MTDTTLVRLVNVFVHELVFQKLEFEGIDTPSLKWFEPDNRDFSPSLLGSDLEP